MRKYHLPVRHGGTRGHSVPPPMPRLHQSHRPVAGPVPAPFWRATCAWPSTYKSRIASCSLIGGIGHQKESCQKSINKCSSGWRFKKKEKDNQSCQLVTGQRERFALMSNCDLQKKTAMDWCSSIILINRSPSRSSMTSPPGSFCVSSQTRMSCSS